MSRNGKCRKAFAVLTSRFTAEPERAGAPLDQEGSHRPSLWRTFPHTGLGAPCWREPSSGRAGLDMILDE
jgi:hypothetical protein